MNFRNFFIANRWWGKILGCFFGYLIAGPAGAFCGLLIGNFFDKGLAAHFYQAHATYYEEKRENIQNIFLEATFSIMGYIAKADGHVSESELEIARQIMSEMRLNKEQKTKAKSYFNTGKDKSFRLDFILTLLKNACHDNSQLIILFINLQYRCAQVDGLTTSKMQVLDYIFKRLGFAPLKQQYRFYEDFGSFGQNREQQYYHQQSKQNNYSNSDFTRDISQAYNLLEVKAGASKQEVKKAYRRLISRHHPDKLIAQGLPEAVIKRANDTTQQITKAYEKICASRGW